MVDAINGALPTDPSKHDDVLGGASDHIRVRGKLAKAGVVPRGQALATVAATRSIGVLLTASSKRRRERRQSSVGGCMKYL